MIHLRNEHEALRIGDWWWVESSDAHVYAYLRTTANETVLVILNLDNQPVTDYVLNLADGPLADVGEAILLLGDSSAAAPSLNSSGGFTDYTPIPELPAQSTFIIELQ